MVVVGNDGGDMSVPVTLARSFAHWGSSLPLASASRGHTPSRWSVGCVANSGAVCVVTSGDQGQSQSRPVARSGPGGVMHWRLV